MFTDMEGEGLTATNHQVAAGGHLYFLSVFVTFLPEAHPVTAPPPQVEKLEAVITATAEQLALVGADVQ